MTRFMRVIHVFADSDTKKGVDGPDKPGHDGFIIGFYCEGCAGRARFISATSAAASVTGREQASPAQT